MPQQTPDTIETLAKKTIEELSHLSLSELELELGNRLLLTQQEFNTKTQLTVAVPIPPRPDEEALMGTIDDLRGIAAKFLRNLNREFYKLVCDESDPDNSTIREAFNAGTDALAYTVVGMLIANFGLLPGIASVVAVIIVKRFANAAYTTACQVWEDEID